MKIVLATTNAGKAKEIQSLFYHYPVTFVLQSEFKVPNVAETGLSFVENAIIKARHAAKHCNMPALADDSGLVVDALQGAPGLYSARYAGENATDLQNNEKLLDALKNIPDEDRNAYFYCSIAYLRHENDPAPIIAYGVWHGMITRQPMGKNGFGYDPVFFIPELNCTSAELGSVAKNTLSHRGKALRMLIAEFHSFYTRSSII